MCRCQSVALDLFCILLLSDESLVNIRTKNHSGLQVRKGALRQP